MNSLLLDDDLDADNLSYLESLANGMSVPFALADDAVASTGLGKHPEHLHALRGALVRLGSKAGALFGVGMAHSAEAVTDAARSRVKLTRGDHELQGVREVLILACAAAHRLQGIMDPEIQRLFAARGIYERLLDLATRLTKGWISARTRRRLLRSAEGREDVHAVLLRLGISEGGDLDADDEPASVELYLHHLEWIADLLWYTFRFDASAYPTNEELAFQVSLEVREHEKRPEFASAAEMWGPLSVEHLRRWFARYRATDATSRGPSAEFYDAIARVLMKQFSAACGPLTQRDPIESVAFTTNFDLELEEALLRSSDCEQLYVTVPVLAHTATGERETHFRWLLGRLAQGDDAAMPSSWSWFPDGDELPEEIDGPLVIKLHGSPLHEIPAAEELTRQQGLDGYASFEHALTLSESEHLRNILLLDSMPPFFRGVLRDRNRKFFLLGQSVSDWGVKLRLFDVVFPGLASPAYERDIFAVNASFDSYRSSVLDTLGIARWVGPLQQVTDFITEEWQL